MFRWSSDGQKHPHHLNVSSVSFIAIKKKALSLLSLPMWPCTFNLFMKKSLGNNDYILQMYPWNGCGVCQCIHGKRRFPLEIILLLQVSCTVRSTLGSKWLYVIRFPKLSTCNYITVLSGKKSHRVKIALLIGKIYLSYRRISRILLHS